MHFVITLQWIILTHFFIFWQARAVSTDGLRPTFYTINIVVYAIQVKTLAQICSSKCEVFDKNAIYEA